MQTLPLLLTVFLNKMKVAILNYSDVYNLASHRMLYYFRGQGHEVSFGRKLDLWGLQSDKAMMSAIFTYDLPALIQDAKLLQQAGIPFEIGGPAPTAMTQYIEQELGVSPHIVLDDRFEHVPGKYFSTFTSRGCPRNCPFCLVPRLEGRKMVEYSDFPVPTGKNPYVCDNNILATSWEHQQLVVKKLKGVKNLDLNSGFDDRIFAKDPEKYWRLWSELYLEMWRFAYDVPEQREPVERCVEFLRGKGIDYRHITVFCLVGFPGQTFGECQKRLQFLIDIKCSPYPMRYRPLDSLNRHYVPPGWGEGQLELLYSYYGVPFIWRKVKWKDFRR